MTALPSRAGALSRGFVAALLLVSSTAQAVGVLAPVSVDALGSKLTVASSDQFAGAISSLVFRGMEYLDRLDHGRLLQSASSFDQLGECFNPTEGGTQADGRGANSSSQLLAVHRAGNIVTSTTDMAFWLPPGTPYGRACSRDRPDAIGAANTSLRAGHLLIKSVTVGSPLPNAIDYRVTFRVPEAHASAVFEAATGYMPLSFSRAYRFDADTGTLVAAIAEGESNQPIVLATADGRHAMGAYAPGLRGTRHPLGYGYFRFLNTVKWNTVFRETNLTPASDHAFQTLILVGTLEEVRSGLIAIAGGAADVPGPHP